MEQVIVIGAGPCGLSAALELKKNGINPLILEKGCIVNSIYGFPTYMRFFSTPELLEIGEVPFLVSGEKPTRQDALNYYREVACRHGLRIQCGVKVEAVAKEEAGFLLETVNRKGEKETFSCQNVVLATGYYDNPNWLGVPGEDLEKVTHYYKEAHPYQGMKVAVIGGKNSAVEAAMELERAGAEVSWIYRGETYSPSIKSWVLPLFESVINKEKITPYWRTHVKAIEENQIILEQDGKEFSIENDYVLALTGYHPNHEMLQNAGVEINNDTGEPIYNPETMETNVPGLFVAGVIAAGNNANVIFIENGRFHGTLISEAIKNRA
jgi:thioredoxin reductase (NADPH)